MEPISYRDHSLLSFSSRFAGLHSYKLPYSDELQDRDDLGNDQYNIHAFRNTLPTQDALPAYRTTEAGSPGPPPKTHMHSPQASMGRKYPTALHRRAPTSKTDMSTTATQRESVFGSLAWAVLVIIFPITLLSVTLLLLVFEYKVKTEPSLFAASAPQSSASDTLFILVDYSATRLVFVASFLSTLAPILTSYVMMLWSRPVAKAMRAASVEHELLRLPTPYQLSLVIGFTLASANRLRTYFTYLFSKSRKTHIPPVVHRAAAMLTFSILLAAAVFVTDTALHYFTTTIQFDQLSPTGTTLRELGLGLTPRCSSWDRSKNWGFPCSFPEIAGVANETMEQTIREGNEIFHLKQNDSTRAEIRMVEAGPLSQLALLLPSANRIPANLDYQASTIALSTICKLITPTCGLHNISNSFQPISQFNCSRDFYGLLGNAVILDPNGNAVDPSASPLTYKPASDLGYAYFTDDALTNIYNSVGYYAANLSVGAIVPHFLPDDQLVNPLFLGLSGRFPASAEDYPLETMYGFYSTYRDDAVILNDFVISCEMTSYDANYTWINGDIDDVSFSPTRNGSVLELFHGRQFYGDDGADYELQLDLQTAALADSSENFENIWANRLSLKALSTIGAYTSPRTSLREQTRTPLLVARVPKPALGALIACALAYVVVGVVLGVAAYRASSADVRDLAAQLSLAGLTAAAFDDRRAFGGGMASESEETLSTERSAKRVETRRIVADGNPENGYEFRAWV